MMEAKGLDATPILATGPITATSDRTKAFLTEKPQGVECRPSPSELAGSKKSAKTQSSNTQVIRQGKDAP